MNEWMSKNSGWNLALNCPPRSQRKQKCLDGCRKPSTLHVRHAGSTFLWILKCIYCGQLSVMLHSYITKNVIFVGKNFGHYKKKNVMWLDVLFFFLSHWKRKNNLIEHQIWMERLSLLSRISLSVCIDPNAMLLCLEQEFFP